MLIRLMKTFKINPFFTLPFAYNMQSDKPLY